MSYTLDLQTIGLILAGGVVIGLLVGLMAGLMLGGGKEPSPPKRGLTRVLTLWRHKTDAALWVHLDEKAVASPDDLNDEERSALARLVMEMYRWLKQENLADENASSPQKRPPPQKAVAPESLAAGPAPVQFGSPLPGAQRSSSTSAFAPSRNPLKPFQQAFQARRQPPSTPPSVPSLSIAAQVDEILQELLTGTPLERRGIRLMELPEQGMVVMIGLEKFATVDEVPYDDVRAVLKTAVARWEEKILGE